MLTLFYEFLSDDDLLRISSFIREMEKKTSGEIAISIKEQRSFFKRNTPLPKLAHAEFLRLGMQRTAAKTGILIYIILKSRELYILADEAIHSKAEEGIWEEFKNNLLLQIKNGNACGGIIEAVHGIGALYEKHLPPPEKNINEVSNRVVVMP